MESAYRMLYVLTPGSSTLHKRMDTARWTGKLDALTAAFTSEFGHLDTIHLVQSPAAGKWSIAQNIDHLIVINSSYFPTFDQLLSGTYQGSWLGKIPFMVRWLGNFIYKSVLPERSNKIKTLPMWEPGNEVPGGGILERFQKHQEELKYYISKCAPLLDSGVVISSPANRNIVYTLEQAFDILVTHEERHLEQAREVMATLHLPGNTG